MFVLCSLFLVKLALHMLPNSASVHWWQSFGWNKKSSFYCFAKQRNPIPSSLCDPPWRREWGVFSVQGAGCDQLVDNSWIGWHQGEISNIVNLLVSTSVGSIILWSAVFIGKGSASCKSNLRICVRPLSISFRELGVQWFCYVAEL